MVFKEYNTIPNVSRNLGLFQWFSRNITLFQWFSRNLALFFRTVFVVVISRNWGRVLQLQYTLVTPAERDKWTTNPYLLIVQVLYKFNPKFSNLEHSTNVCPQLAITVFSLSHFSKRKITVRFLLELQLH